MGTLRKFGIALSALLLAVQSANAWVRVVYDKNSIAP